MESEETCRSLVHQLMSVGRDVRSTPMQWSYEGKKLDCAVKHLSWCPPWVEGAVRAGPEVEFLQDNRRAEDRLGLGRIPAIWWTLNCRYNAAYDIHRLNVGARFAREAVDVADDSQAGERFAFIRDCPDLATYMLGIRMELHMRVVMPSVVPHSADSLAECGTITAAIVTEEVQRGVYYTRVVPEQESHGGSA